MDSLNKKLELWWWIFTIVFVLLVLYPIATTTISYPFLWLNIMFIVVFITSIRYTFLLKTTFLPKYQKLKIALFFIGNFFLFAIIEGINNFKSYIDDEGIQNLFDPNMVDPKTLNFMMSYIHSEMLFFGVAAFVACFYFQIRMIVSVWRVHNKKGIV